MWVWIQLLTMLWPRAGHCTPACFSPPRSTNGTSISWGATCDGLASHPRWTLTISVILCQVNEKQTLARWAKFTQNSLALLAVLSSIDITYNTCTLSSGWSILHMNLHTGSEKSPKGDLLDHVHIYGTFMICLHVHNTFTTMLTWWYGTCRKCVYHQWSCMQTWLKKTTMKVHHTCTCISA